MYDKESVIRKIRSLLRITEGGSNATDNEVRVAAAKARELLSQYNLSMTDVSDKSPVNEVHSGLTYNNRYSKWKVLLASRLAKFHRCMMLRYVVTNMSMSISFIGEGDMPEFVKEIFVRITRYLESNIYSIHDQNQDRTPKERYRLSDSYCYGFIMGLSAHYEEQTKKSSGMDLMVQVPQSITDEVRSRGLNMETHSYYLNGYNRELYNKGYQEGYTHEKPRIGEGVS